ncbi:MAG: ribonuclease III [Acholeplasmataceae bacterium]
MNELFDKLKIKPKNTKLFEIALTHSSYANENNVIDYERLEFLGDAILQIITSDYLYKNYQSDQGVLTKTRASIVREEALYYYAKKLNLAKYIKLGHGELNAKPSIQADVIEALFAAIYLDLGIEIAFKTFEIVVVPYLEITKQIKDYKTELQEFIQLERKSLTYKTNKIGGPSHKPVFKSNVYLEGNILLGTGIGNSKIDSEQKAAEAALLKVVKEV